MCGLDQGPIERAASRFNQFSQPSPGSPLMMGMKATVRLVLEKRNFSSLANDRDLPASRLSSGDEANTICRIELRQFDLARK